MSHVGCNSTLCHPCLGTESEGEAAIWDMPAQGQEERGVAKPTMLLESLRTRVTCRFHIWTFGQSKSRCQMTYQWSRNYNPPTETN